MAKDPATAPLPGKLIDTVPVGGGQSVYIREPVPGGGCEVHSYQGQQLATAILAGLSKPGGINTCPDCITRARDYVGRNR